MAWHGGCVAGAVAVGLSMILTTGAAGFGAAATQPAGLVFTSNQYGFRLSLPPDWSCRVPTDGTAQLRAYAPYDRGRVTPNLFVEVELNRQRTPTRRLLEALDALVAARRRLLMEGQPPCPVLREETVQLPTGQFVGRQEFRVAVGDPPLRALRFLAVGTYYSYLLTFYTPEAHFAEDAPCFERIASSFFVLPAPAVPPPEVAPLLKHRDDGFAELDYARRVGLVRPLDWVRQPRPANWLRRPGPQQRIVMELAPEPASTQPPTPPPRPVAVLTAEDTLEVMTAANRELYLRDLLNLLSETYQPTKVFRAEPFDVPGEAVVGVRIVLTADVEDLGPTRVMQVTVFKHFTRYTLLILCPESQVQAQAAALATLTESVRVW